MPPCHDNIFVERLWWTVKHEWIYLRPAANGIEQKRSLASSSTGIICGIRVRRSAGEPPDEAYLDQSTVATALAA
jgi:putative transposase